VSRTRAAVGVLAALAVVTACASSGNNNAEPSPTATSTSTPSATTPSTTASASPSSTSALARFYEQKLSWHGCGGGFQCTSLTVPLDYANPGGGTITIAVNRLKASGSKRGSILVNPGGPGGSGVDYAKSKPVTKRVREHYDLIGFDPRGVGKSSPVRCATTKFLDDLYLADASPDTPTERQAIFDLSKQLAEGCQERSARLLPHVSTADAARDMDVLRAALGDAKLTYMGKSYGTYLGAVYAGLFPTHVRALILDGAIDPTLTTEELNRTQAKGFETALDAFLRDCIKRSSCPLDGTSVAEARVHLGQFIDGLDSSPLPTRRYSEADGRDLTQAEGVLGIATALYSKSSWSFLRDALKEALGGDGSTLLYIADQLVDRHDHKYSNQSESNMAINCLDHPAPKDAASYDRDAAAWAKESPVFGEFLAYGSVPCAYWPVPPLGKDQAITAPGSPPILVSGTLRDPATPYSWAVALSRQLSRGVLLTYDGDGHTVYGEGSACVDRIADDYLLDLKVPATGVRC
jgi:pimeloyl-ACP methyl ester carboxylesterase